MDLRASGRMLLAAGTPEALTSPSRLPLHPPFYATSTPLMASRPPLAPPVYPFPASPANQFLQLHRERFLQQHQAHHQPFTPSPSSPFESPPSRSSPSSASSATENTTSSSSSNASSATETPPVSRTHQYKKVSRPQFMEHITYSNIN